MRRLLLILLLSFLAVGVLAPNAMAGVAREILETASGWFGHEPGGIPLMAPGSADIAMAWYMFFAAMGAGFVFLGFIFAGIKTLGAAWNPGVRAANGLMAQRAIIALLLVMLAPSLISLAVDVNNAVVAGIADQFQASCSIEDYDVTDFGNDVISSLVASIPRAMLDFCANFLDLHEIQAIIFNDYRWTYPWELFTQIYDIQTGNDFADMSIDCGMMFFEVYFNIYYVIRAWTFGFIFAFAPVVFWIWAVTGRNEVVYGWLSTVVVKIFCQSVHAAVFAITFSFLASTGAAADVNMLPIIQSIVNIGLFCGKLFGLACVGTLVYLGARMMFATSEQVIADLKASMVKCLAGLGVVVLAWPVTSVILGAAGPVPVAGPAIADAATGAKPEVNLLLFFVAMVSILSISRLAIKWVESAIGEAAFVDLDRETSRVAGKAGMVIFGSMKTFTSFKNNFGGAIKTSRELLRAGADAKAGIANLMKNSASDVSLELYGGRKAGQLAGAMAGGGDRPPTPPPVAVGQAIPRTQVVPAAVAHAVPPTQRLQPAAAVPQTEVRQPAAPAATPPRTEIRPAPAAPAASPPRTEVRQPAAPARYQPAVQQLPPLPSPGAAPARPASYQPAGYQPTSGAGFVSYTGGGSTTGTGFSGFGGRPNLLERYRPAPERQRQTIDDMNNHEDFTRRSIR